jgi:plastocyanin
MIASKLLRSAAAASVLVLSLAACGGDDDGSSNVVSTVAGGTGATGATTDKVEVKDFSYKPETTTVKVGTTVTWTFGDDVEHNVTPVGGSEPKKSPDHTSGETFTHTFATAGTFGYRCSIHNSMTGSVVVTA